MLLDGKVALVTGGGSGFGRAASQALAAEGAAVVVADVREEGALETAEGIRQRGGRAIALAGDVSREAEARRLVDATLDEFGRLDILDNNAGVDAGGGITEFTLEELNLVFGVNVYGTLFMCKHAIPAIAKNGGGAIVNIASAAGLRARPGMPLYAASKGAVVALTRALALDCAPLGIRVNCICPTAHDTPMLRKHYETLPDPETAWQRNLQAVPMGRLGRPEEVAQSVLFLVSDQSSYITGHALVLDGGSLAGTLAR